MIRAFTMCLIGVCALAPAICFSWGEGKHPISELLIHHVYLDSNCIFCGSDAAWGSNVFGLFVFDRSTESWTNYPAVEGPGGRNVRKVVNIEREEDSVYVTFDKGSTLRFDRRSGLLEKAAKRKWYFIRDFTLDVDGEDYRIYWDSVIVGNEPNVEAYTPASESIPIPTGTDYEPKASKLTFSHPVVFQKKIYMAYDLQRYQVAYQTEGLAIFDPAQRRFHFHQNDFFEGTITGSFVYDDLIVLSTARFRYEANAGPAAGFVAFDPTKSTFSQWKESPLPEEPLAILDIAQDDKEYWIGTDKGVFRIDKKTEGVKQYQIAWGVVSKDVAWVHSACGFFQKNSFPVVAELDRGRDVDIVAVWSGWCEIKSPRNIAGFVEGKYVEGVTLGKDGDQICRFSPLGRKERIAVRVSDEPDAELMVELDANSSREYEYTVVARVQKRNQPVWYKIKLPTAWINMDDLVFQLGEAD